MGFYSLQQQNLYGSPNPVLANANSLSQQINGCGSGFANFNGTNGCFPVSTPYTYAPGYAYMPTTQSNPFGYGFGGYNGGGYGETSITATSDSYSYHNGPSTLDYINVLGGVATGIFGAYSAGQAAKAQAETQQQSQMFQYMATKQMMQQQTELTKIAMGPSIAQSEAMGKIQGKLLEQLLGNN